MRACALLLLVACGHPAPASAPHAAVPAREVCADPEGELAMPDGELATIDPAGVVRALDEHRSELRRCYQPYLKQGVRGGKVTATFAVRGDGRVSQIQMKGFAEGLDRCLCNVVARVQFPAPPATAIVSYPIQFSGS